MYSFAVNGSQVRLPEWMMLIILELMATRPILCIKMIRQTQAIGLAECKWLFEYIKDNFAWRDDKVTCITKPSTVQYAGFSPI